MDYPTFSCDDPQLELYLTDQITAPIQALQRRGQMAQDDAYADGGLDEIRGGYNVSLDFPGLLSVEARCAIVPSMRRKLRRSFSICW